MKITIVEGHPMIGVTCLLVTQASWTVHTDLGLFIFRTTSSGHKLEPAPSYCIARFCCNYYCLPVASVWRLQFWLFFQLILLSMDYGIGREKKTFESLLLCSAVSNHIHWKSWWKRHSRLVEGRQKLPTVLMNWHSRHFLQRSFWNRFLCFCLLIDYWYGES